MSGWCGKIPSGPNQQANVQEATLCFGDRRPKEDKICFHELTEAFLSPAAFGINASIVEKAASEVIPLFAEWHELFAKWEHKRHLLLIKSKVGSLLWQLAGLKHHSLLWNSNSMRKRRASVVAKEQTAAKHIRNYRKQRNNQRKPPHFDFMVKADLFEVRNTQSFC